MSRVKNTAARRHRVVRKQTKGFKHSARKRVRTAKEALLHAGQYAYAGRRKKRRDLRKLWTIRLNAAARKEGLTYAQLVTGLKKAKIELNRKILADIAANDPKTFKKILTSSKMIK